MNVFDFAIELERKGRKYYRELAREARNEGVRAVFAMMAEDEEELMRRFRAMKAAAQTTTMEDSRALDHLGDVADTLFDQRRAADISGDLEAYNFAMEVERDVYRLYEDAAGRESNAEAKKLLLKIAGEERRELESLRKIFDFVNAPNEFLAWGEFSNLEEFHNFGRDEG